MTKTRKTGLLDDTEIISALQHSGFPLEIRLLQAFHEGGFDPIIGHRFIPGQDERSAEVDLIAYTGAALANHRGHVYVKAMVEAKQLGQRVAFVGFKWKKPDAHEMRSMRIRFSGSPTCQVLANVLDRGRLVQL